VGPAIARLPAALLARRHRPGHGNGGHSLRGRASLIASRSNVGKVGGIVNFSNQLSGIAAPIVTGYLVSARQSFAWAFGVPALYLAFGIAAYVFLLGRIERIAA
jgi:hypothetical protein